MTEFEGFRRPEAPAKTLTPTKTAEKKIDETSVLTESPTQGTASVIALQNSSSFNAIPSLNTGTTAAYTNTAFNNSNINTPTVQKNLTTSASETNPPASNANPIALSNKTASTGFSANSGASSTVSGNTSNSATHSAPSGASPVLAPAANFSEVASPTTTKSPPTLAPVAPLAVASAPLTSAPPEVRSAKITPSQDGNSLPKVLPALPSSNTLPTSNSEGVVIANAGGNNSNTTGGSTRAAMVLAPQAENNSASSASGGIVPLSSTQKAGTISVASVVPRQDSGVPVPDSLVEFETPTLELKLEETSPPSASLLPPGLVTVKVTGQLIECDGKKSTMSLSGKLLRIVQPLRHEFIEVAFDEASQLSFTWNIDPKSWNPETKRSKAWEPYLLKKTAATAANPELRNKAQTCQGTAPECFSETERAELERIIILNPDEFCSNEPGSILVIGD